MNAQRSSCLDTPAVKSQRLPGHRARRDQDATLHEDGSVQDYRSPGFIKARSDRATLLTRLYNEGERDLAAKLAKCGEEFTLHCQNCAHDHRCEKACNLKWCPVCARRKSAQKVDKYAAAALRMKWPLGITLTVCNVGTIDRETIRWLKRCIVRLRRTKLFRQCVAGGLVSIELVNTGKGWHPHAHLLVDAEWISLSVAKPSRKDGRKRKLAKFKAASQELHDAWCAIIGQLMASIYVRRAKVETLLVETLKYCVKPGDLIDCPDPIGDAIRAISDGRLSTPFGSIWGVRRELTAKRAPFKCPSCAQTKTMIAQEPARNVSAEPWYRQRFGAPLDPRRWRG